MEVHAAVEGGVVKLQDCGVETKTASGQTVEGVADDGGVEPVGMGAVDAELVGASCGGGEAQQGGAAAIVKGDDTQHFVERMGGFAVGEINAHPWQVEVVGGQGQTDFSFLARVEVLGVLAEGGIFLVGRAVGKLCLQVLLCFQGSCYDHQSAGEAVQAVDRVGTILAFPAVGEQGDDGGGVALARHGEEASGLFDDGQLVVLIEHAQLEGGVGDDGFHLRVQSLHHPREDGAAAQVARGVILAVMAHLFLGGRTPPEHGDTPWVHLVEVGILQEFGFAAFACSRRAAFHTPLCLG